MKIKCNERTEVWTKSSFEGYRKALFYKSKVQTYLFQINFLQVTSGLHKKSLDFNFYRVLRQHPFISNLKFVYKQGGGKKTLIYSKKQMSFRIDKL